MITFELLPHIKTVLVLLMVVNNYPPQTPPAPQESKGPLHGQLLQAVLEPIGMISKLPLKDYGPYWRHI